ncbi:MAG TPA: NnrS family protein [Burkholderiales bacterium]|nr:NnrS family protein [Burkholderiales bacterium]
MSRAPRASVHRHPWWQVVTWAPHRAMFAAGAVQACFAMAWWMIVVMDRFADWYTLPQLVVSPDWVHGYLMVYGVFPFFMLGFLMTALPSWVDQQRPGPEYYLPSAALMFAGVALFYPGIYWSEVLVYLGLVLQLAGWLVALVALAQKVFNSQGQDLRHPLVVLAGMAIGALGLFLFNLSLVLRERGGAELAMWGGIWMFLFPVFVTVAHRMIPYFSSRVIENYKVVRPYWALWVLLAAGVGHGLAMIIGFDRFAWVTDVPGVAVSLYLIAAWRIDRCMGNRLLAVLHIAFLWLPVAFALSAWQSFGQHHLSGLIHLNVHHLVPLHALAIGFFSSMLIGMASRVSLGHSGRPLVADTATWVAFLAVNAAAVGRVAAEMPWAVAVSGPLLGLSAAVWLLAFCGWAVKYLPMVLMPRVDGKLG